jgi:signal peptide peptidase SppA
MDALSILNSPWAIAPEKYAEIRDLYEFHLHADKSDIAAKIAAAEAQIGRPMENQYRTLEVVDGVGILAINGLLAKRMNLMSAFSGGTSTQLLQRDFSQAMQDPLIHSILLVIDSPGGEVGGTQEFCNQIFEARGKKPIVAVCEGAMTSAAYWIGSSADELYISSGTTQVGSIGVVAAHTDMSKAEANRGVKVTEISAGKYKRLASEHEPLSAEGRAELQNQVDQIYTVFVDDVARNRGVSSEKVLSEMAEGRIFIGQKAVDVGLVDGKRTTRQALQQLKDDRQQLLYPTRSASSANHHGGSNMAAPNSLAEDTTQKIDSTMSPEQVAAIAKTNWQNDPKLHCEFTSEGAYIAFCKADAAGRVRILGRARTQPPRGHLMIP